MDMAQLFHIAGRFWLRRGNLDDRSHDFRRAYSVRALLTAF
jgi:hypothetical protein